MPSGLTVCRMLRYSGMLRPLSGLIVVRKPGISSSAMLIFSGSDCVRPGPNGWNGGASSSWRDET